jgi:hypothetical protein
MYPASLGTDVTRHRFVPLNTPRSHRADDMTISLRSRGPEAMSTNRCVECSSHATVGFQATCSSLDAMVR